jgi:peptide/nickel transport system ATP-binding protein
MSPGVPNDSARGAAGPVLSVRDLTVALPRGADRAHAVEAISFDVQPGEVLCLLGESGSGKSIIAQTVMGLLAKGLRATSGSIRLEGEDLLAATPERLRQLRGARMSMVFQEPMTALNPVMTCGHQIEELLHYHTKMDGDERRRAILAIFEQVRLPTPDRIYASYPHQLSGGQRQRIMIAMALILKPALLIADEPTTALDVTTQAEILRLIRDLQRETGTAVLFITHDFGVVAEIADRVAVLQHGHMVEQGATREVLERPREPYTQMLVDAVPSMVPPHKPDVDGYEVLATRGLGKTYASGGLFRKRHEVRAAADVDLLVRQGETLGIVGESGSGKSTVARCIAHLIEPTAGEIRMAGGEVRSARGHVPREFRRQVQIVFQDPYRSLNPRQTVGSAIVEGPVNFGLPREAAWARAEQLMDLVRLSPKVLGRYPSEFSGGQRQRICIARALALEPKLLIADEAVSALDVSVQAQILRLFEEIKQRLRLAVLFITHDLRVAAQICDRVMVMQKGVVVEQGRVYDVFNRPQHEYTRALLAAAPGRGFTDTRRVA